MKDRIATPPWQWRSSEPLSAERNMAEDVAAISEFDAGRDTPLGRWYEWRSKCVTYGSRQPEEFVRSVVPENPDIARRPTGGGICIHQPDDLALSLFMPRALADVDIIRQWRDVLCRTVQNYHATSLRQYQARSAGNACSRAADAPPGVFTSASCAAFPDPEPGSGKTPPQISPPSARLLQQTPPTTLYRTLTSIPSLLVGTPGSRGSTSVWCDDRFVPGELVDGAEKVLALSARIGKYFYLLQASIRGIRSEEKENFRIQVAELIPALSTLRGVRRGFPGPGQS